MPRRPIYTEALDLMRARVDSEDRGAALQHARIYEARIAPKPPRMRCICGGLALPTFPIPYQ